MHPYLLRGFHPSALVPLQPSRGRPYSTVPFFSAGSSGQTTRLQCPRRIPVCSFHTTRSLSLKVQQQHAPIARDLPRSIPAACPKASVHPPRPVHPALIALPASNQRSHRAFFPHRTRSPAQPVVHALFPYQAEGIRCPKRACAIPCSCRSRRASQEMPFLHICCFFFPFEVRCTCQTDRCFPPDTRLS